MTDQMFGHCTPESHEMVVILLVLIRPYFCNKYFNNSFVLGFVGSMDITCF